MIIPIRCFGCGNVVASKWRAFVNEMKRRKGRAEERYYMDGTQIPQTAEHEVLTRLGLKRSCCRVIFLTHVDLMEKI